MLCRQYNTLAFCLFLALSGTAIADDSDADLALNSLVKMLNTRIATRTVEQQSDLAPGVITVIEKETLVAAGVRTVSEALTLIPGFDNPEPQLTDDEPIFRGIGGILTGSSGKIRFMVNGIVTNNVISSNSSLVLQLPVEQIERIEIISGPGSAIYGEYALLGVINVITESKNENAYARIGGSGTHTVGGVTRFEHGSNLSSSLNLSFWETDGANLNSGTDLLTSFGQPELSRAPGKPNLKRRFLSTFYRLDAIDWSLSVFFLADERGDGFGAGGALSGSTDFVQRASQIGIEWKATQELDDWTLDYRLAAKRFEREYDNLFLYPAGFLGIYVVDLAGNLNSGENRFETGLTFSRDIGRHTQIVGLEMAKSDSTNELFEATFDPSTLVPVLNIPAPLTELTKLPLGFEGKSRTVSSVYFSDQVKLNEQLEVIVGARFDDFSDIKESGYVSPRIASTYKIDNQQLFKTQYARALRPPSFRELYTRIAATQDGFAGNPDLDAEIIDTLELVHDFRDRKTRIRSTLFASEIEGLIRFDNISRFNNVHDARSEGLEISFEHHYESGFSWFGNVTFIDATNADSGGSLEGSTDRLANLGITWQPRGRYSSTLRYQYVGDRFRAENDARDALEGYDIFNFHGLMRDFLSPGLTLRFGVNNLLNEETLDPAPAGSYVNDYPGSGREVWLQLSQNFD